MAWLQIPTPADSYPRERIKVQLEGKTYGFVWDYSDREDAWYLSLEDDEGTPIISGLKVITSWDLLFGCVSASRPPGELVVVDTSGDASDAVLADLGSRVLVLYQESA